MKMKKNNKRRLNNKGFTLIELLAVVVILAVVMGIAMNSVLTSMNKSRAGSLADTAQVIANAFNQKYTESLVDGVPTSVYGDVTGFDGYDFSVTHNYYIEDKLADTFNISSKNYALHTLGANTAPTQVSNGFSESFVSFNATTGKFVVCMVANKTGSNFVEADKVDAQTKLSEIDTPSTDTTFNSLELAAGNMLACSDGARTW